MSHFIKIYAVCNFSYFLLWYLKVDSCPDDGDSVKKYFCLFLQLLFSESVAA